ncbi:MAG TPA: 3-keto-5-aminohexanoate cleavage protein [Candidatus Aminicenantes bacterium]|nr:3-keto-5-aminohexanoate cleavage protein [Candidatus Aminicenantes bacterium]
MMEKMTPLVINLAPTGIVPSRRDNLHLPVTPAEIAADVARCFAAGARVFHLHARAADGEATCRREVFADLVSRVRRAAPQAIVAVSTSGRRFPSYQDRSQVLDLEGELKPDLASLTPGSMNFPREASVNAPDTIARLAAAMLERGIVPELEIFDFGMLDYVRYLIGKGALRPPFVFNLLLGSLGTLAATPLNLALLIERLPAGSCWSAAGIGRFQFAMNALGVVTGGHVRTGLEDSLFLDEEKLRQATNVQLVERIARLAEALGRPLATPEQARQMLGLAARDS